MLSIVQRNYSLAPFVQNSAIGSASNPLLLLFRLGAAQQMTIQVLSLYFASAANHIVPQILHPYLHSVIDSNSVVHFFDLHLMDLPEISPKFVLLLLANVKHLDKCRSFGVVPSRLVFDTWCDW